MRPLRMWSNASSSPLELRPAAASVSRATAGLGLAVVAAVLALADVPAGPAAAALLLGAGGLGRAAGRGARARALRSPGPGQWCVVRGDGTPEDVSLLRAWALGGWLAVAGFALPDGRHITVTLLCRDQAPAAWRRFLIRLRSTSGS